METQDSVQDMPGRIFLVALSATNNSTLRGALHTSNDIPEKLHQHDLLSMR
jgi:hypothetical protein